ncbi:hypothetical protein [Streptomyces sp. HNM0574]|uniref:hypothetical protein n=1 Tax=Streptomyces sp. HNM0574 TaxID=2714954 RepID=UPI00146D0EDB|nr:hypothetical protein [Streptomyces sp. HNM0574]NLU66830.1 hypothetical protein [Streptomyces sp. HNM0574]
MSYPPPPGPGNPGTPGPNPYAQQPGQVPNPYAQQQPYGYPQQAPSPYAQQPGGYPPQHAAPTVMPSTVKAARVMLFVLGGLGVLTLLLVIGMTVFLNASASRSEYDTSGAMAVTTGVAIVQGLIAVVIAAAGFVLGAQVPKGGNGVRVGGIIYGSLMALGGLISIFSLVGIVPLALGTMVVIFLVNKDGEAWFNRPRY